MQYQAEDASGLINQYLGNPQLTYLGKDDIVKNNSTMVASDVTNSFLTGYGITRGGTSGIKFKPDGKDTEGYTSFKD